MAINTWTGATSTSLNVVANWTPSLSAGAGGAGNRYNFDNSASQGPTTATAFTWGSLYVAATYTLNSGTITINAGANNFNFAPPTGDSFNGYGVYLSSGKIFSATGTNTGFVTGAVPVYLESGAQFRTGSYLGSAVGYARVYGLGKFYLCYNQVPTAPLTGKGIDIYGGTVALRGADYNANAVATILNPTGTITFATHEGRTGTFNIEAHGFAVSRTFANPLSFASGATFKPESNITLVFSTASITAGGTLTHSGVGTLQFTSALSLSSSIAFTTTGTLTFASSSTLSGETLSSTGACTLNIGGCTLSSNAPSFTGAVTGTFTYNATGGRTFGGNAQGTVTVTGGTLTATASNSGTIAHISGGAGVTLSSNGTFTGDLAGYTYLGQSPSAGVATFSMVGHTAAFARNLSLTNGSNVRLSNGATLASPIVVTNITSNTSSMTVEDETTNTFTGSYISDGSVGSDNVSVKTGGTLVVSGSIDGRRSDRVWNLNNADGYAGTIRITGVGFYNSLGNAPTAAPAFLKRGKIQFARAGVSYLAGGLTVESGATIACAASNAAYAAQLSGNLTLSAGATMQFGAP